MFEPFAQEGRDDTSERRAAGLGLPIVKKFTDLMGRTIFVESEPRRGDFVVKFTFDTVSGTLCLHCLIRMQQKTEILKDLPACMYCCEDHPLNQEIAGHC